MTDLAQRKDENILDNEKNNPLMSVIIISYNNAHYLHYAVKSVLKQSYNNIELTISDDASVGCTVDNIAYEFCWAVANWIYEKKTNFIKDIDKSWKKDKYDEHEEKECAERLLEEWKKKAQGSYEQVAFKVVKDYFPNIRKLTFLRNKENLGTVKHLKSLKKNANGKYLMFLAADDKLHDSEVVSDMVAYFETLPEDAYVLTSQCGMYDENLEKLNYYAVNDELKEIITKSTPMELFAELTDWCIIPAAGTIYKKKAFEVYGDLDERYHLIEDWTYFLKLTRAGGKIYFYDRLTYMHRDGGISHGNNTGGSLAYKYYLEDSILLTQQEIFPYLNQLTFYQKIRALRRYRSTCREYERKFKISEMSAVNKIMFILKYGDYYFVKLIYGFLNFFEYRTKYCFELGMGSLLGCLLLSISPVQNRWNNTLYYLSGLFGIALILFVLFINLLYFSLKVLKVLKKIIKAVIK